jgi:exonuclease SbcD
LSFKFVHIADVHLDTPFGNKDKSFRTSFSSYVKESFSKVVDLTIEEKANALLIAGDLFDSGTLSFATEIFLTEQLNRLGDAGIRVFYAPGNHDPVSERLRIAWPSNVTVFDSHSPSAVEIKDNQGFVIARIIGAGHEKKTVSENLAKLFEPCSKDGIPHIGLCHAMVNGYGGSEHDRYAPCEVEDLLEKNYIYWALGHIHKREVVSSSPYVVYPGNLIGRNVKETGQKGAYVVEINDGYVDLRFVPIAPIVWSVLDVKGLDFIDRPDKLIDLLKNRIAEETGSMNKKIYLRINLAGPMLLYNEMKLEGNIEALREELMTETGLSYIEIDTSGLAQPVDPAGYCNKPHVLGTALQLIERLKEDDKLLLSLKPDRLAGLASSNEDELLGYLRSLLENMDYDITARLLKEEAQ